MDKDSLSEDPLFSSFLDTLYQGDRVSVPFESNHFKNLYETYVANEVKGEEQGDIKGVSTCPELIPEVIRVKEIWRNFQWVQGSNPREFGKSPQASTLLRCRATKDLCLSNFREALRGYNLSVSFAPPNSIELALSLEKRAELLLKMGHPDLAQKDINTIAGGNIPGYMRIMKSGKRLLELQERVSVAAAKKEKGKAKDNKLIQHKGKSAGKKLFMLKEKNKEVDNLEKICDIDFHETCGRRIIAREHVQVGKTLLLDKPYTIVLEKTMHWDMEHCTVCSKQVLTGIPCSCCTFAIFCSEACQNSPIHRYERYLPYLKGNGLTSIKLILACRILFRTGVDELYRVFKSRDPDYFQPNERQGYLHTGGESEKKHYPADHYLGVFHMVNHENQNKANAFKAVTLCHLMEKMSGGFFNKFRSQNDLDHFKIFISALILRHIESIGFNAITVSELKEDGVTISRYGCGVFPVLTLVNHSCSPNAILIRSLKTLRTALITLKPLSPGEEVTFCYAPHYSQVDLHERQKYLWELYRFECGCEACREFWSPRNMIKGNCIPECQCETCGKYLLTGQCPKCQERDIKIREEIDKIKTMLQKRQVETDAKTLEQWIQWIYTNVPVGNLDLGVDIIEMYKKALINIVLEE